MKFVYSVLVLFIFSTCFAQNVYQSKEELRRFFRSSEGRQGLLAKPELVKKGELSSLLDLMTVYQNKVDKQILITFIGGTSTIDKKNDALRMSRSLYFQNLLEEFKEFKKMITVSNFAETLMKNQKKIQNQYLEYFKELLTQYSSLSEQLFNKLMLNDENFKGLQFNIFIYAYVYGYRL